jgi:hypothetical protein
VFEKIMISGLTPNEMCPWPALIESSASVPEGLIEWSETVPTQLI